MSAVLHTEERPTRDARVRLLLISLTVIVLDRVTKVLVAKKVAAGAQITVIPHVFAITHVVNIGAAFSMFAESASPMAVRLGLVTFSIVAVAAVLVMLWRYGRTWSLAAVGFALVLGGAIGNLYDRVVLHYVIDFLQVYISRYHWPDFNVADSAISVGAVLLLAEMIWPRAASEPVSEGASQPDAVEVRRA